MTKVKLMIEVPAENFDMLVMDITEIVESYNGEFVDPYETTTLKCVDKKPKTSLVET